MTLTARATKSLRIRDIAGQRSGAVGFTKLVFAHEANDGDSTIDLTALSAPTGYGALGFVQPSANQLLSAEMKVYRKNLTLRSSVRGVMNDYDDYVVSSNSLITFQGFTLQDGEIITGTIDKAPMPGLIAVDNVARPFVGTLLAGSTTLSVGWPFEVNKFPTTQCGSVVVVMDGFVQVRCVGNTVSGAGNYVEGSGSVTLGNTIQFKDAPFAEDRQVMVIPMMAAAVAPSSSLMAYIEALNSVVRSMIPDLAVVTGNPESNYTASPSAVDLSEFGGRVTRLDTIQLKSANYQAVAGDQLICDTSSAAFAVTLPATPTVGQRVTVMDAKLSFGTNNLTVSRNGSNIDGAAQDYLCDINGLKVEFIYVDASQGWTVFKLVP